MTDHQIRSWVGVAGLLSTAIADVCGHGSHISLIATAAVGVLGAIGHLIETIKTKDTP